jgi:DNA-binding transcriptional regulator YiaG
LNFAVIQENPRGVEVVRVLAQTAEMLTPEQCKAARALLSWKQSDLSEKSGVGAGTIKDFESKRHSINSKALTALIRTFQKAGLVLFFADDSEGSGVRWKSSEAEEARQAEIKRKEV